MLLFSPFCPLTAGRLAGLLVTVLLLIKALVQIKLASALGFILLALQTLVFLTAGWAFAMNRRQSQAA